MGTDKQPIKIADYIIEKCIGKKPRKAQTYDLRKSRGTDSDIKFCEDYDKRLAEWNVKFEELRLKTVKEREKALDAPKKERTDLVFHSKYILSDFLRAYKIVNGKDFNKNNPYSNTDEPLVYAYTLIYYFNKDEKFFDSPLLRKDLSNPSFDKGLLSVGGYGCGKTSAFKALSLIFKNYVEYIKKEDPKNKIELLQKFSMNDCVTTKVVQDYRAAESSKTKEVLNPLLVKKQLYIDDLLREQEANNYGKLNIFLDVLTTRADKEFKTHASINFNENYDRDVPKALMQLQSKYDSRVYDRAFGSFNILELTGKSFRR